MLATKSKQLTLNLKEVQLLFDLSSNILDQTEEFIEESAGYKKGFIDGLNRSLKEVRTNKVSRIGSLKELMN